jgi:hypothetical protein
VSPDELFYTFPEPVPTVCWRLRDLVLEVAPEAVEEVRPRWKHLGFNLDGYFCAVAPQVDGARIVFDNGVELPDPDGRLEGYGPQVRWLSYARAEDIDEELVRGFLRAALTAGSGRATARPR